MSQLQSYPPARLPRTSVNRWEKVLQYLILTAVALAFLDEIVRKAMPSSPVALTGFKTLLLIAAVPFYERIVRVEISKGWSVVWGVFVIISAAMVYLQFQAPLHFAASLLVYLGPLAALCAGRYIGMNQKLRTQVARIGFGGLVIAVAIAFMQELYRSALPIWLTRRIYKEGHSLAGGDYVESIFASPTIAAILFFVGGLIAVGFFCFERHRRWLFGLVAFACLLAMLATRIRCAIVIFVICTCTMIAFPLFFGARKSSARVATTAFVLLWIGAALLVAFPPSTLGLSKSYQQDVAFFNRTTSLPDLLGRAVFGFHEIKRSQDDISLFGTGIGTSGALRSFLPRRNTETPRTHDTGMHLILIEGGYVGLIILLCLMISLHYGSVPARISSSEIDVLAVSCWVASVGLTVWFFLKAHPILGNSFSQMLWFGCIGFSYRSRRQNLPTIQRRPPIMAPPQ